jgi:hypothetical protein
MAYTPPATNAVNFDLTVYTAPATNAVNFDVQPNYSLVSKDIVASSSIEKPTIGQAHVLTSKAIVTSSPTIEKPTAGVASSADSLTALDIILSGLGIGKPVIGQVHALTSKTITTTPALDKSTIGQVYWLTAKDIETTANISKPILAQTHAIISDNLIMSALMIGKPTLRIHRENNTPNTVINQGMGNVIYARKSTVDISGTRIIQVPSSIPVEAEKVII